MTYTCCMPQALKTTIFDESTALRATYIRVDVELDWIWGSVFERPQPEWSKLYATLAVARAHPRLRVLGVLTGTPGSMAEPCGRQAGLCPPRDPRRYAARVGQVVRHARGVITTWELVNEPCLFTGVSATRYASMLKASYRAIKAANPRASVVIGDPVAGCSARWLPRVLELAPRSFDIANLHLRGTLQGVARAARRWRGVYRRHGRGRAALWVTEFGYPAATDCQADPGYRGGEAAQARYLAHGLSTLTRAGASQVFVTLRDNLDGCWASEGVAAIATGWPYVSRRKPAFQAVRRWRPPRAGHGGPRAGS
jgi:hypothetical protein